MKTVALIAHYLGPKLGIGQYLDQLLPILTEILLKHDLQPLIFCSPNAYEKTPTLHDLSEHIEILPPLDTAPLQRWTWVTTRFKQHCNERDVVCVVWLSNPMVLPWHPTSIAVIHDVNEWKTQSKYGSFIRTLLRSLVYLDTSLIFAKKVIAISESTQKDLLEFRPKLGLHNKLSTILNGMDSSLVNLDPIDIPKPVAPFLLSVGRIDPKAKLLPEAINLVHALREISREPWEIHLIGGMNTSTQQDGETFLASIKTTSWVTYHGHVSEPVLAQWYRNATAIVFLSEYEGFGLPIAEASSFSRWAIVNNKNKAATEVGGSAQISIDPDDSYQAAEQVILALEHNACPPINQSFMSWRTSANLYAHEIIDTLSVQ